MEAEGSGRSAFLFNSTVPVDWSNTNAAVARVSNAWADSAVSQKSDRTPRYDGRARVGRCNIWSSWTLVRHSVCVSKALGFHFFQDALKIGWRSSRSCDNAPEGFTLCALLFNGRNDAWSRQRGGGIPRIFLHREDANLNIIGRMILDTIISSIMTIGIMAVQLGITAST